MRNFYVIWASLLFSFVFPFAVCGQETRLQQELKRLPEDVLASAIGVTRQGTAIPSALAPADLDYATSKFRVLLVGGLDAKPESVAGTVQLLRWFYGEDAAKPYRERFVLSAVPCLNPDGYNAGKLPQNLSGGEPGRVFPPAGKAYSDPKIPEAIYLWRWIGMHAPDLVVTVTVDEKITWLVPQAATDRLSTDLKRALPAASTLESKTHLAAALGKESPSNVGPVAAVALQAPAEQMQTAFGQLLDALEATPERAPSPARRALQRRLARTPAQVAEQLAGRYGQNLNSVVYIPAVALIGRLRLAELTGNQEHAEAVRQIAAPYLNGDKPSLPQRFGGSHLSGHLIFAEIARRSDDKRAAALVKQVADLGFDGDRPRPSMPAHSEMSDAVFMGGPVLAYAGRLTGDRKYFDQCRRHVEFMQQLCLRKDGLYRHSPLDEAAWGRGNGFPALGLALILSQLPKEDRNRAKLWESFRAHLQALAKHQDPTGCWHQVIDRPESYRELTCTCMIGFAMARGVLEGWLDADTYRPRVERAWYAVKTRVAPDATLVDVCTGTGKQKSLRAYYDRTAILGQDARGGAMSLLFATEMIRWEQSKRSR